MSNSNFQNLYKKLNAEQKKAVDTIDGPVLVLAGPGTGKTQVLTMRIANILLQTDTPPDAILALTFTESGVKSMHERLRSIIGKTAYYVNINTFHSFASDIIRANQDEFIATSQLEPLSDLERVSIFRNIFDDLKLKEIKPFNAPYFYLSTAISRIKDLKREGVDTNEYLKLIKNDRKLEKKDVEKNLELQKVYLEYQKKLRELSRYDFEDMINFVIDKFKSDNEFLLKTQERFQYFLVDEFQDTNSAQAELLYHLTSFWDPDPNLFVVGDDDQSIYRFQGASIENIKNFEQNYPNAKKITLAKNYRSIQPIIDASQAVIKSNKNRFDKSQVSVATSPKSPKVVNLANFTSSYTENYFIAKKIKELLSNGTPANEIAVIYRNNADATDVADMLARTQIQYSMEGGQNILETGLIVRLLHLLQVIEKIRTVDEDIDLFTLLNYEFLDLDSLDILKLSRFASNKKLNLFEALAHKDIDSSDITDIKKLLGFHSKLIEWNGLEVNSVFIDFLETVLDESGFVSWILNEDASYEYLNRLNSFLSEVKRLNYSNKNLGLSEFLDYIDLMRQNNISINEETLDLNTNSVRLMTAHKAKGMEFSSVFIPKFIDKKWSNAIVRDLIKLPHEIMKTSKEKHQEEDDRRLFFVTLTRAKKEIYITHAENYQTTAYTREAVPSMFETEIPEKYTEKIPPERLEKEAGQILKTLLSRKKNETRITENEKEFLKSILGNFKLSASSLNTYLECAYKFKLNFLFRTPEKKSRPLIMGSAIHFALEKAYKKLQKGEKVPESYLLQAFSKALKSEILTKKEHKEIEDEGNAVLATYYKKYNKSFLEPPENLIFLEKFLGWGFSKPVLDNSILLQGKIDKMEILDSDESSSKVVKVTDYKSGRPKSRNEILGKTKYSTGDQYRQLLFYKLLIELDNTLPYKVRELVLDYTGDRRYEPKRESFHVSDGDIESLKKTIRQVHDSIMKLKFDRTTNYSVCTSCRFFNHCWPDGLPKNDS